jgi:hypothetical protein
MKPLDQLTKDELKSEINAINMDDLGDIETWMRRELLTKELYRRIRYEAEIATRGDNDDRSN